MSHLIIYTHGGGLFSCYHQALEKVLYLFKGDYSSISSYRIVFVSKIYKNPEMLNSIFDIKDISNTVVIDQNTPQSHFLKAYESPYYNDLKTIVSKNKLHPNIVSLTEKYRTLFNIGPNTLAVHIRLTDMNIIHPEYGVVTLDTYITKIRDTIKKYPTIDSVYLCSDNIESLQEIKLTFPSLHVTYIEESIRVQNKISNSTSTVINQYNTEESCAQKIFTEMYVASLCGYFICRVSDVSNFIILYSNTFKDIICLK
jgi:hypothetical protein